MARKSTRTAEKAAREHADRIKALAAILVQTTEADAKNASDWGTAGSLEHVSARLAELVDMMTESEEGTHASAPQATLDADAGFAGFPEHVDHDGSRYYFTGKEGRDMKTGTPAREYADRADNRLWADGRGRVTLD